MGIQAMTSSQSGSQAQRFQSLRQQVPFYNLSLDEIQNQMDKPLGSMNMDEILKNVWSAEDNPSITLDIASPNPEILRLDTPSPGLSRTQGVGNTMSLSRVLSRKVVDEVWQDIQHDQTKRPGGAKTAGSAETSRPSREMTLEDFLMKAGVVTENDKNGQRAKGVQNSERNAGSVIDVDPVGSSHGFNQQGRWLEYPTPPKDSRHQSFMGAYTAAPPPTLGLGSGPLFDVGFPDTQLAMSQTLVGTISELQLPGRKRAAASAPGEVVERTVERRQKRMIKNRESAARSRARKQAYTNELENKVSRLEEENDKLRKQKQELQAILHCEPPPEPKFQLRRTNSAPPPLSSTSAQLFVPLSSALADSVSMRSDQWMHLQIIGEEN